MPSEDDLILQWAARAATPWERTDFSGFRPCRRQTPAVIEDRRKCWIESAAGGDYKKFQELLAKRGIDEQKWLAGLQDFEVADAQSLPQWVDDLRAHLARTRDGSDAGDSSGDGYSFWSIPGRRDIDESLREYGLDSLFRQEARRGFTDYLVSRLVSVNYRVWMLLLKESPRQTASGEKKSLRQTWMDCFNRYPVLAKLCVVLYRDWLTGCRELMARLAEDRDLVVQSFFDGADPGAVVKIQCGAGDPHDGGRSVALLTFERGALVYKPKPLQLTAALNCLLHDLSQISSDDITLTSPMFVDRGAYGWEAFVAVRPCRNPDEIGTFYSRLGAWLQLLEVMNGIDYWFDNLFACGASPVFIDHELVVQPPMLKSSILATSATSNSRFSRLAMTGILPFMMPDHVTAEMLDISCVAPPGWHRSPLRRPAKPKAKKQPQPDTGKDGPQSTRIADDGTLEWKEDRYVARYNNRFYDVSGYMDSFVGGYAGMGRLLCSPPAREAFERFFDGCRDARARHILLDTWSCYGTTDFLTTPQKLGDGVRYEIALERLWDTFPMWRMELLESAMHDFRHCDVPFFWVAPGGRDLHGLSGEPARDYFEEDAVSCVRENLHGLNEAGIQAGCDAVHSLFSTRPDHPRRKVSWPARAKRPSAGDWLDAAVGIGDGLIAASETRDRNPGWHGITCWPSYSARFFSYLEGDLGGTAGIGVYLARLYQATDEPRFADYAERILHRVCDDKVDSAHVGGAIYGSGSRLIAALHLSEAMGVAVETGWMEEAVRRRPDAKILGMLDYPVGTLGLLCALGFVDTRIGDAGFARTRARELFTDLRELSPDLAAWLPGIKDAEPAEWPGVLRAGQLACSLWPDLAGDIAVPFQRRDAPERAGDLIAELLLAQRFGESAGFDPLAGALNFIDSPPQQATASARLAQLWVALSTCIAEPAAMEKALEIGAVWFAVFQRDGRWFVDEWAGDAHLPTAVSGLSSLGLALLALHGSAPVLPPWLVDCNGPRQ